jgi:dipeptidyl aminopeptidase/acylaminoacyl peptidase
MKTKFLLLFIFVISHISVNAQMDDKFYYPSKKLQPIDWSSYEELKYNVENDTITALIMKPKLKPKGTIFYFHGAGGNLTYYFPLAKVLLENNLQVVLIDFRGYGKSTGIPTHNNISKDGKKIFDMLLEREEIKNTKKIIYGISIGTQVATLLAKNYQDKINGLILEGAMSSFTDIAIFNTPQFKDYLEKNYISPYSAKEDIKDINKILKLIVHSKEDKDVPFTQGKIVFNNASEPKEFLEFKGEHLYALKYEKKKILQKIDKMINIEENGRND